MPWPLICLHPTLGLIPATGCLAPSPAWRAHEGALPCALTWAATAFARQDKAKQAIKKMLHGPLARALEKWRDVCHHAWMLHPGESLRGFMGLVNSAWTAWKRP